jgi:glycosyltransferase involved in cell wall biosynthesis
MRLRGVEIELCLNSAKGSLTDYFDKLGITYTLLPEIGTFGHAHGAKETFWKLFWPWSIFQHIFKIYPDAIKFRNWVKHKDVDIVHINSIVQLAAGWGAKMAGKKVVWHIREQMHPGWFGIRKFCIRKLIDYCAFHTIAISELNAERLNLEHKCTVVYNYVDEQKFNPHISSTFFRKKYSISDTHKIVVMLGGMVEHKGIDILLKAAAIVIEKAPNTTFLIAGDPPYNVYSKNKWKRKVRKLLEDVNFLPNIHRHTLRVLNQYKLRSHVIFTGMLTEEIPQLISEGSMLVWPAKVSHFSRPIAEAGMMGKPVIASRFESSEELVKNNVTGLLVKAKDHNKLAEGIIRLLTFPDEAKRMGKNAYELGISRYEATQNNIKIFDLYKTLLLKNYESKTDVL